MTASTVTGVRTNANSSASTAATETSRSVLSPTPTVWIGAASACTVLRVVASIGPSPMRPVSMPSEISTTAPRSRPA